MQSQGTLQEIDLATLLQTMQAERATGTLFLEQDTANCSLFFLFGHLFHAEGTNGKGEDVVLDALSWKQGGYTFDPRAKLPPEETITASAPELIAQAQLRAATVQEEEPELVHEEPTSVSGSGVEWAAEAEPAWAARSTSETVTEPEYHTVSPEAQQPVEHQSNYAEEDQEEQAHDDVAGDFLSPFENFPVAEEIPQQGQGYDQSDLTPEESIPVNNAESLETEPVYEPSYMEPAAVAPPVEAAPMQPVPDAAQLLAYPLPSGNVLYERLKSSFIDFSRLLRTLKTDSHTGYIRLVDPTDTNKECALLFLHGDLVEGLGTLDTVVHGEQAFIEFRRQMDAEIGLLDVIEIDDRVVSALSQFFTGQYLYTQLMGRFIDFQALLGYLQEQHTTGHVLVTGGSEIGLILLSEGEILGSYTENERKPTTDAVRVSALTKEQNAKIEVRTSSGSVSPLDIKAIMGF